MKKEKILKNILIVLAVGFVIMLIINIIPKNKQEVNEFLSMAESKDLLKYLRYDLNKSENLQEGSITDEAMVKASFSYMLVFSENKDKIEYDYENFLAKVSKNNINEIALKMFNKKIDYSKITFNMDGEYINVPILPTTGDMQVYKYNRTEYNKETNTYIAYIDCLEPQYDELGKLIEPSETKYSETSVIATMVFKYKEIDGRRVLIAYNMI